MPFDSIYQASARPDRRRYLGLALSRAQMAKEGLASLTDDHDYYQRRMVRYLVELHRKYTLSVACILFFFIGAPLGAIIKKGGFGVPTGISVLFFVVYYVVSLTTEKFARQLTWDVLPGMWFSTWILVPVALALLYRATNESSLLRGRLWPTWPARPRQAPRVKPSQPRDTTE